MDALQRPPAGKYRRTIASSPAPSDTPSNMQRCCRLGEVTGGLAGGHRVVIALIAKM